MTPKVAVVYLSYGVRPFLDEVLSCWEQVDYPRDRWELIIVDNPIGDGSADLIREKVLPKSESFLPKVTLIVNETNTGFAEGNNTGIRLALEHGVDYVYLENNDAKFHSDVLREAVKMAESDDRIGSVQSLMLLWKKPEVINSTGGMVHFLGFGFVRDNGKCLGDVSIRDGEEIAYASGAAVLYRASVLRKVGFLDPFLFLYHEDLELGWRIRLAGYRNVLSVSSIVYHQYEFRRSIQKFFWMERNRILVHASHLRLSTLVLLFPLWLGVECALLVFAIKGGWWKEKKKVYGSFLQRSIWRYVVEKRYASHVLRQGVSDRKMLSLFTAKIEHQDMRNVFVEQIGNPLMTGIWRIFFFLIRW